MSTLFLGVLAQVAFPLIQTFDSSGAPQREQQVQTAAPRPPVDLAALAAALEEPEDAEPGEDAAQQVWDLQRRLRLNERRLAAALARVADLEAAIQAR